MLVFMILFETLIKSLLCGWAIAKPQIRLDSKLDVQEWETMKTKIIAWIHFYNVIEVFIIKFLRSLQNVVT